MTIGAKVKEERFALRIFENCMRLKYLFAALDPFILYALFGMLNDFNTCNIIGDILYLIYNVASMKLSGINAYEKFTSRV